MTTFALLFTLSTIGISETVYLIKKRKRNEQPFCPLKENCLKVLNSKYSRIFIVPNDLLGLISYIIISFLCAFLVVGVGPTNVWILLLKILVLSGSIISVFFTWLQWRIIKSWCTWCLMSAFTMWLMEVIILASALI